MKKRIFTARLLPLAALFGFVLAFASCANEDAVQKPADANADNDKSLTTFTAGTEPSRTSMDYATGNYYWESGDHIYVKDDDGAWQKSKNAPTGKTDYFKFKVPGRFGAHSSYKVYYPGKNGSNNQVNISATQTQVTPGTTDHFGTSGDCGAADAKIVSGKAGFVFTLKHQASILVFQPHTSDDILKNCRLTKVEVTSDNDITGTYTLDPTTGELTGTGTGKQIVITTKGSGAYADGFPLNTASASLTTNGAYMFIKPGVHRLKVRYWVKNLATGLEGTITKAFGPFNYARNEYNDMTGNLDIRAYNAHHYYMWDAKKNYWYGHEWDSADPWQPTLNGTTTTKHYKTEAEAPDCWPNETPGNYGTRLDATHSCATAPNVNEAAWYVEKGDPRWDDDELFSFMGHLYKGGGIWLKKKSHIPGFSTEHTPDGRDLRIENISYLDNTSWESSLPDASVAWNYFFLPALGYFYDAGIHAGLLSIGEYGSFWSSSAEPRALSVAYNFDFRRSSIRITTGSSRVNIAYAQPFSVFGDE